MEIEEKWSNEFFSRSTIDEVEILIHETKQVRCAFNKEKFVFKQISGKKYQDLG